MLDVDERHWWYRGRRRVIRAELDRLSLPEHARILDAGCGSGRTLEDLVDYGEVISGLELNEDAAQVARSRGVGEVQIGRLEEIPWESDHFDLITCLDVLEHVPDDREALSELRRVTRPGGWLLATVPAYQALWSSHDNANHHYRRYERATLRAAVADTGWDAAPAHLLQHAAVRTRSGGAAGPAPPPEQERRRAGFRPASGPALAQPRAGAPDAGRGKLAGTRTDASRRTLVAGRAPEPVYLTCRWGRLGSPRFRSRRSSRSPTSSAICCRRSSAWSRWGFPRRVRPRWWRALCSRARAS